MSLYNYVPWIMFSIRNNITHVLTISNNLNLLCKEYDKQCKILTLTVNKFDYVPN